MLTLLSLGGRSSQGLTAPGSSASESLTDLLILDILKVVITKLSMSKKAHHSRQSEESTNIPLGHSLLAKPSLHFTCTWSAWYEVCCCHNEIMGNQMEKCVFEHLKLDF